MTLPRFQHGLAIVLAAGAIVRAGYVLALAGADPAFAYPILDGAYYTEWARTLRAGGSFVDGAYYLEPLPAFWLALLGASPLAAAAANVALTILAAAFAGLVGRRAAGDAAGWTAAALLLAYHPILFFAARPLGEALGVLFLVAGAWAWLLPRAWGPFVAGASWGVAALARPNVLLVPLAAAAYELLRRDVRRGAAVVAGLIVIVLPVAGRNWAASGHLVPVSSNGGVTFFHGNGPDATGVYQPASGLSGAVVAQQKEATAVARARTGRPLDEVEADAWWGRQALSARLAAPWGTARLLARKAMLAVDNAEHGLDYAPRLDRNPWRWTAPVPFALLFAFSVYYFGIAGVREDAPRRLLVLLGTTAAVLVTFYVSSRYRIPFAAMLTIPAAAGFASALGSGGARHDPRWGPRVAAMAAAALSCAIPSHEILRWSDAAGLANRASSLRRAGDLAGAERELRAALAIDPASVPVLYNLGVVATLNRRDDEAEALYRRALAIDPGSAEAAANLGSVLIGTGRSGEAIAPLRTALQSRPADRACWTNLVVALAAQGSVEEARAAAREAARVGVPLDPGLLREIDP
jgi:tetratricopeptide (TPR) repeat protein